MLDLHSLKQVDNIRHKLKIIPEKFCLKHGSKIFGNFLTLMETAFKIVGNFCNIGYEVIFWIFSIIFGELELDFFSQEELDSKIHDFLIFLRLKVIIIKHGDTATNHKPSSTFMQVNRTDGLVAGVRQGA